MPAPTPAFRYLLLVLPAVFLLTAGARLYGFLHQRDDVWWTPRGLLVPLAESHDRVAVYVGSRELDDLLAAGQLRLLRDSVAQVLNPADIGLRFNNWDRVRAERIASVIISGVTVGAAAALLLVGLIIMRAGGYVGGVAPPGAP